MAKSKPVYGRGTGKPHPVDVHVGARVRMRRTLLGMTQTDLGDAVGLTFQQVQKYERGTNRISASRLYDLARVLDVSIEHFFEDMSPEVAARSPAATKRGTANCATFPDKWGATWQNPNDGSGTVREGQARLMCTPVSECGCAGSCWA